MDNKAVFNSLCPPLHNTTRQVAIKTLIDSFIRTTNQREGGRVENTQTGT